MTPAKMSNSVEVSSVDPKDTSYPNSETLKEIPSDSVASLSQTLAARLVELGDSTLTTPDFKNLEKKKLREMLQRERRGLFGLRRGQIDTKDSDELWVVLRVLYPEDVAAKAYLIVRSAQTTALEGKIPEGWNSQQIHQAVLKSPATANKLNRRQILVGNNPVLSLFNQVIAESTVTAQSKVLVIQQML